MNLFPLAAFDLIENAEADARLIAWGHWLGGCNRPFGRQSFGLFVGGGLVSVAVSASTTNAACGGFVRGEVVELARLASDPAHRWATRPTLRLWREVAAPRWPYWSTRAYVSYQNAIRHTGNLYRFDGWKRVAETRGGSTRDSRNGERLTYDPKVVWVFERGAA